MPFLVRHSVRGAWDQQREGDEQSRRHGTELLLRGAARQSNRPGAGRRAEQRAHGSGMFAHPWTDVR